MHRLAAQRVQKSSRTKQEGITGDERVRELKSIAEAYMFITRCNVVITDEIIY